MFAICLPRPLSPLSEHILVRDAAAGRCPPTLALLSMVSRVFPVLDESLLSVPNSHHCFFWGDGSWSIYEVTMQKKGSETETFLQTFCLPKKRRAFDTLSRREIQTHFNITESCREPPVRVWAECHFSLAISMARRGQVSLGVSGLNPGNKNR